MSLANYIGQHKTITTVNEYLQSSRQFPHTLFVWPFGSGKTTLARIVCQMIDPQWNKERGEINVGACDQYEWLDFWDNFPFNVALVDEIQDGKSALQKDLRKKMTDGIRRSEMIGGRMRPSFVNIPVLAAGTTEQGIHTHVYSRFAYRPTFVMQTDDEFVEMGNRMAIANDTKLPPDIMSTLVNTSMREPRRLGHLVEAAASIGESMTLDAILYKADVFVDGLTGDEARYMGALHSIGGTGGKERIAAVMNEDVTRIPKLERTLAKLGYVSVTTRRRLTDIGKARLMCPDMVDYLA